MKLSFDIIFMKNIYKNLKNSDEWTLLLYFNGLIAYTKFLICMTTHVWFNIGLFYPSWKCLIFPVHNWYEMSYLPWANSTVFLA